MATNLNGSIHVMLNALFANPQTAGTATDVVNLDKHFAFSNGTGADQADIMFRATDTIGASGTKTWDLQGVQVDAFGTTIAMAEVCAVIVVAAAGNTNNVVVGNATDAFPLFGAAAHTCPVQPGGVFMKGCFSATGLGTSTAASTDDILITNSAGGSSVTYDIYIIGRSA